MNNIVKSQWYEDLIEDCKDIITEAIFTSRWALVEGYWNLGKRIREDLNFQEYSKGNKSSVQDLARNLKQSERTLYYAIQCFDTYPDIQQLPEGKNITWNKLMTKYLPESKNKIILPLPEGKFQVLLADPPWQYRNTGVEGAVDKQYSTLSVEELCKMPIKDLTTDDAVLFLWITNPILKEGLPIMEAWGFEYKTNFVWIKENKNTGIGFYVRGIHELLLIGIKGSFLPSYTSLSVINAKAKEHSRKPEIYDLIEKMYPVQRYLELFARNKEPRERWTFWGDEAK